MSVQASEGHYCTPRVTGAIVYTEVEVGYPSSPEKMLEPWAECPGTSEIYAYVPISIVEEVVKKHGGMVNE